VIFVRGKITELHELLRTAAPAKGQKGAIALYERFREIKDGAQEWLRGLDKNGFEHLERLEEHLNRLTRVLAQNGPLTLIA
jgi:gamma-glutamyl:cysteine ligase YbdK (ATP-grasp superfamily)